MVTLQSVCLSLVLFSALPASPDASSTGLRCVTDYVIDIACEWDSSGVAPNETCRINAEKNSWTPIKKSCELKPVGGPGSPLRRCAFGFDAFLNSLMKLNYIQVICEETVKHNLNDYRPVENIKMNPPGVPIVIISTNETTVSWSPGDPLSSFIFHYKFQVEIKQAHQQWKDALNYTKTHKEPSIAVHMEEAGVYQVRVKVCPQGMDNAQWSDWSPTSSWKAEGVQDGGGRVQATATPELNILDCTSVVVLIAAAVFTLVTVLLLVLYKACPKRRKHQHVPDPSKYFMALNSVHGGNFQEWLSPMFAPEDFLPAQPCRVISSIEVSETVVPSTSTPGPNAPLHSSPDTTTHSSAGGGDNGQSSSPGFSNIGYFTSTFPSSLHMDSYNVYFNYDEGHLLPHRVSLTESDSYERLHRGATLTGYWREPQSPDSGFSTGSQVPSDEEEASVNDVLVIQIDHLLPLPKRPLSRIPCWMPTSETTPSPSAPQLPPPNPGVDGSLPPGGSYNAWPVESALGRSSSMTMEPCRGGYLTIKELQSTYSNKSI